MKNIFSIISLIAFALSALSTVSFARDDEDAIGKLSSFKATHKDVDWVRVDQNTKFADNVRKNILPKIKMPAGFKIELFAVVPDARNMAVSRNKGAVWIGTRKDKVWQATDRDMDNVADTVEQFAPTVNFDIPNGPCYSDDGHLYIAERNRVLWFPAAEYFMESADTVAIPIINQGELIPVDEESYNHTGRVCAIGPDNKLYVSLGQPFNVTGADKLDMYREVGIGGMISFNRFPGELDRKVVATGIRNSGGHAFNKQDGSLWFTDNQVDGMGDETPPGELNRMPKMGMWYGHPYYGGGDVRTADYSGEVRADLAKIYVKPQVEMIAHAADLGMMFYDGDMFPKEYDNAIFSAQHGSWNAVKARGARIMVTFLDKNGNAKKTVPFAEGWMTEKGRYIGRPVDVQQYIDGSILVSDDKAGVVYRISYGDAERASN